MVDRLEQTRPRDRYLSCITLGEIYHGIYLSARVQRNLSRYRAFFKKVKIFPKNHSVAEHFGLIKADLQRRGLLIEDHDIWIASHALAHNATVASGNENHFNRIQGLRIQNWLS